MTDKPKAPPAPQQQIKLDDMTIVELYELMLEQQNELMRIRDNIGALRAAIEKKKQEQPKE